MASRKNWSEEALVSLILRLAMASLFAVAAIGKFLGGLENVATQIQTGFQGTWLPMSLVRIYARVLPYIEAIIPVWLILGWRLRSAWVLTGILLVTLSFGTLVMQQGETTAHNYFYVFLACAGLYFSKYDHLNMEKKK